MYIPECMTTVLFVVVQNQDSREFNSSFFLSSVYSLNNMSGNIVLRTVFIFCLLNFNLESIREKKTDYTYTGSYSF